jgi:hypothetical protein
MMPLLLLSSMERLMKTHLAESLERSGMSKGIASLAAEMQLEPAAASPHSKTSGDRGKEPAAPQALRSASSLGQCLSPGAAAFASEIRLPG